MAIQSLRTGDCIDEVIDKYSTMVYRLAVSHTDHRYNAEDVEPDAFDPKEGL